MSPQEKGSGASPDYTVCSQKILLSEVVTYTPRAEPMLLEVIARDKGQLTLKQSWRFRVKDSNDNPTVGLTLTLCKIDI